MNHYPSVELVRLENDHQYGSFGVLRINKVLFCVTLEPPDFRNETSVSCIPTGQYLCSKIKSPRFGDTYEVRHVPGRSNILFHAGNRVKDTEGCILLGQFFGKLHGDRAALNSGSTFKEFLSIMKDNYTFHLTVKECF